MDSSSKPNDLTDIPVKRLDDLDNLFKHVHTDKNADEPYLRGLNNGIILGHATIFGHEPEYIEAVEKPQSETAWLIERDDSTPAQPIYFYGIAEDGLFIWGFGHNKACRFARKEDAEKIYFPHAVRIAQHAWDN